MAQAEHESTTRRGFVRLATAAGFAAATLAPEVAAAFDPIFAAIERHKAAYREFDTACTVQGRLERLLPCGARLTEAWDMVVEEVTGDDPRWIENQHRKMAAYHAEDAAALALLNVRPATAAGLVALLRYAHQHVAAGNAWPDDVLDTADDGACGISFCAMLHQHAAETVLALAGGR